MNQQAGRKIAPVALAVLFPSLGIAIMFLSMILDALTYSNRGQVAIIVTLMFFASLVTFIIFWVQIVSAKKHLGGDRAGSDEILDQF